MAATAEAGVMSRHHDWPIPSYTVPVRAPPGPTSGGANDIFLASHASHFPGIIHTGRNDPACSQSDTRPEGEILM